VQKECGIVRKGNFIGTPTDREQLILQILREKILLLGDTLNFIFFA
jgi:hypothetical protein